MSLRIAFLVIAWAGGSLIAVAQSPSEDLTKQSNAAAPLPAFDVASIRANTASSDGHNHIYNDSSVSLFRTVNLSTKDLIRFAYGLPKSQILGGPEWLDSTMFDITAKADATVDAQLHAMPYREASHRKQLMVQALLAERYQFKAHLETRELPIFALVVANSKAGPKFKISELDGTTIDISDSRLHVAGSDDTLYLLSSELARIVRRPVLNRTGLSGRYDLRLRWTPDDIPAPLLNGSPDPNASPDIFTAIQEQLGLQLESTNGPVEVLVIDHIELPTEN